MIQISKLQVWRAMALSTMALFIHKIAYGVEPLGQVRTPFCIYAFEKLNGITGFLDLTDPVVAATISGFRKQNISLDLDVHRKLIFGLSYSDSKGVWSSQRPGKTLYVFEEVRDGQNIKIRPFPIQNQVRLTSAEVTLMDSNTHTITPFILDKSLVLTSEENATGKVSILEIHRDGAVILTRDISFLPPQIQNQVNPSQSREVRLGKWTWNFSQNTAAGIQSVLVARSAQMVVKDDLGASHRVDVIYTRTITAKKAPGGRGNLTVGASDTFLSFIATDAVSEIYVLEQDAPHGRVHFAFYLNKQGEFILKPIVNLGKAHRIENLRHASTLEDRLTKSNQTVLGANSRSNTTQYLKTVAIMNFINHGEKIRSLRIVKTGVDGRITVEARTDKHFYSFNPMDHLDGKRAMHGVILPQPLEGSGIPLNDKLNNVILGEEQLTE